MIDHERNRWSYMSFRDLSIRLGKITKLEKLNTFLWYCTQVEGGFEDAPMVSLPDVVRLHGHALERADILGFGPNLRLRYPVTQPRTRSPQSNIQDVGRGATKQEVRAADQLERQVARDRQLWETSNFFQLQRYVSGDFAPGTDRRSLHDFIYFMRLMAEADHTTRERQCRVTPGEALELMRQATRRMTELGINDLVPVMLRLVDEVDQHLKDHAARAKIERDKTSMGARVIRVRAKPKKEETTIDDLLGDLSD